MASDPGGDSAHPQPRCDSRRGRSRPLAGGFKRLSPTPPSVARSWSDPAARVAGRMAAPPPPHSNGGSSFRPFRSRECPRTRASPEPRSSNRLPRRSLSAGRRFLDSMWTFTRPGSGRGPRLDEEGRACPALLAGGGVPARAGRVLFPARLWGFLSIYYRNLTRYLGKHYGPLWALAARIALVPSRGAHPPGFPASRLYRPRRAASKAEAFRELIGVLSGALRGWR